jgi:hypothetical protein
MKKIKHSNILKLDFVNTTIVYNKLSPSGEKEGGHENNI